RPVDRDLRQDACPVRPGRVPARRRGRGEGAAPAGRPARGGRALASLVLLRGAPSLGHTRTTDIARDSDTMILPFLPVDPAVPTRYDIVDSPGGSLLLTGDDRALTGLYMLDAGEHSATVKPGWTRLSTGFPDAAAQLAEYFDGKRTEFDLPLAPCGT